MTRSLPPGAIFGSAGEVIRNVHLVELVLDEPTGVIRLCDAIRDLEWEGSTYTRGGNLLSFSDIEESAALMIHRVTVGLSGVDQALIALVLSVNYIDRPLRISRGWLNETSGKLSSVALIFEGNIDRPGVAEDPAPGTSTVQLTAASIWVDFERKPGRKTNHDQQQQLFPGDLGFQYASQVWRELPWGRP